MDSIYGLKDPGDNLFHYVGMAKDPYRRYAMHLLNVGGSKTEKDAWIKELRQLGLSPLLEILEVVEGTREEAGIRETYWINHFLDLGMPLKNYAKNREKIYSPPPKKTKKERESALDPAEEWLHQLLREYGWTLYKRTRRGHDFFYALKWKHDQIYITAGSKLPALTREQVLDKLSKAG